MSLLLDLFQTNETRAENLTCGSVGEDSGDPEQKLILKWHPDSEMVFFFRKKNEFNILHHVVLRMLIPLDDKEESYYGAVQVFLSRFSQFYPHFIQI